MSTLASTHPTMLDVAKRLDPNGQIDKIVEMLSQNNEVLDDAVWIEGNLPTGTRTTIRTGLPAPTWRKLYGGVQPSKSTTAQVTESCGMLEMYAEVDKALADLNSNTAEFRLSEEAPFIESLNQELARAIFYEDESVNPERITGLAPRFNGTGASADNVINGGTTPDNSDNASIYLVNWAADKVCMIYPKGSKAGIQMQDKGQVTIENVDGSGGRMEAYRTHYRLDCGVCVRDWRYVVRASVNAEDLIKDAATGDDLIDIMTRMLELIKATSGGRPAFYMNRKLRAFLRRQLVNKVKQSTLTLDQVAGKTVMTFDGIPVRRVDQLTNTESGVASSNLI